MSSIIASRKCEYFGYNLCLLYENNRNFEIYSGKFNLNSCSLKEYVFNTKQRANRNLKLICLSIHAQYPFVFPRLAQPYTFVYPSLTIRHKVSLSDFTTQ